MSPHRPARPGEISDLIAWAARLSRTGLGSASPAETAAYLAAKASLLERIAASREQGEFRTNVITRGTEVTINAFYKHSRIKQYLKNGRALRVETVVNAPGDLGCQRRLHNLDELQARARAVNARLLQTERAGQACVLANPVFERIAHPSVTADGRRATAMRFGDSRV